MPSTLIVNARLVNEDREFEGDLRIEKGRIAQIGSGLSLREGDAMRRGHAKACAIGVRISGADRCAMVVPSS